MPSRMSTCGFQPMMLSAAVWSIFQAPPALSCTLPGSGSTCSGARSLPASSVTRRTISSVVVGLGPEMLTATLVASAAKAAHH